MTRVMSGRRSDYIPLYDDGDVNLTAMTEVMTDGVPKFLRCDDEGEDPSIRRRRCQPHYDDGGDDSKYDDGGDGELHSEIVSV
jgi:hypothetical protein